MDSCALRGGSWNNHELNLRCSSRNNNPDNRNNNIGFRVVRAQSCPYMCKCLFLMPVVLRNIGLLFGHDMVLFFLGDAFESIR